MKKYLLASLCFMAFALANCGKEKISLVDPYKDKTIPPPPVAPVIPALNFSGANWACPGDNYSDGWLLLSELKSTDSYATVQSTADRVYTAFASIGINSVRLPINPSTVMESWWSSYTGVIDKALSKGMKVILCCWEGTSAKDGKIDDMARFWSMWTTVVGKYGSNANVYFEIFNEPFGYSKTDWANICAQWLDYFPGIPKGRVLVSGTGYSSDVTGMGADSRFAGCYFALHIYPWFASVSGSYNWEKEILSKIGDYAARTVVTEFGCNMSAALDYAGCTLDNSVAYLQGVTRQIRLLHLSCTYWPGYRTGDAYGLLKLDNNQYVTNSVSGLNMVQYGWGAAAPANYLKDSAVYKIVNRNSGAVLDVSGASGSAGTGIVQSTQYTGAASQQWQVILTGSSYYKLVNKNSGMVIDVNQGSSADGAKLIQWGWNSGDNQQWYLKDLGSGYVQVLNRFSGKVLDMKGVSTDQAAAVQGTAGTDYSQQWQFVKL